MAAPQDQGEVKEAIIIRRRITECLEVDLETELWHCQRCQRVLGPARRNWKEGTLVAARDPAEIHERLGNHPLYNFSPHPDYCRIVEFYCPQCGVLMDTEYLPPGHPLTYDIQLDLDSLKRRYLGAV